MSARVASPAVPRWRRRKGDRPREIVDAALDCFIERGFAATRLEDVARRAGVSKSALFLYFPNKAALFAAAVRAHLVPTVVEAEEVAERHLGDRSGLLRRLLTERWSVLRDTRLGGIPRLLVAEGDAFPELAELFCREVGRRVQGLLAKVIEAGIGTGEFRRVDPVTTARLAITPLLMAAVWRRSLQHHEHPASDLDLLISTHIDHFLRGLAAGGAA